MRLCIKIAPNTTHQKYKRDLSVKRKQISTKAAKRFALALLHGEWLCPKVNKLVSFSYCFAIEKKNQTHSITEC